MTEPELALVASGAAGVGWIIRWAIGLWATVRREDIEATKATAAEQHAQSNRMVDALLAQSTSNAVLGGKIEASNTMLAGKFDQLSAKLDRLSDLRERTPNEGFPVAIDPPSERSVRRARGSPETGRILKPHNDD